MENISFTIVDSIGRENSSHHLSSSYSSKANLTNPYAAEFASQNTWLIEIHGKKKKKTIFN